MGRTTIPVSELSLVGAIFIVMAALVLVAKVNSYRADAELASSEIQQENILVTVSGAVSKPGEYWVPSGTTLKQVLRKARPKTFADLRNLPLNKPLEGSMGFEVGELSEVQIKVIGAVVKELDLVLPVKSRICDLKSKVVLSDEADKAFFRSRKFLKNGDCIEVPKKTVEDNSEN